MNEKEWNKNHKGNRENTEKRMKKKNEAKFKKQSKNETPLTNERKKNERRVI